MRVTLELRRFDSEGRADTAFGTAGIADHEFADPTDLMQSAAVHRTVACTSAAGPDTSETAVRGTTWRCSPWMRRGLWLPASATRGCSPTI